MRTSNMATRPPDSVTWEPFIHFLPPDIPPVPVQTGQSVSPSTYGLTWLYHIIILAAPSVCPVVLSSVQTRSPIINPSVYCPTLLHTACVEQVPHKYGWHGEHLSRWVGSRCRVSETERHTCWPGISGELYCCFMSHTLWDTHKHYGYQVDLEFILLTYASITALFWFCRPHWFVNEV